MVIPKLVSISDLISIYNKITTKLELQADDRSLLHSRDVANAIQHEYGDLYTCCCILLSINDADNLLEPSQKEAVTQTRRRCQLLLSCIDAMNVTDSPVWSDLPPITIEKTGPDQYAWIARLESSFFELNKKEILEEEDDLMRMATTPIPSEMPHNAKKRKHLHSASLIELGNIEKWSLLQDQVRNEWAEPVYSRRLQETTRHKMR